MYQSNQQQLEILMDFFIQVANSLAGKQTEGQNGIKYAETIAKKTFSHITSAHALMKGIKVNLSDGTYLQFIDHSSIAVITRAAIESYLTFNHLFISAGDKAENEFRYYCWDLYGFIERQNFKAEGEVAIKRKSDEAKRIKETIDLIRTLEPYKSLTPKQRIRIEKGQWKLDTKWADLAKNAGFDKELFKDMYSYLCSYAHTGRLSALQIMQSQTKAEQLELAKPLLGHSLMILSKFITDYVDLIPEAKPAFDANKEGKFIANVWKGVAENLKKE